MHRKLILAALLVLVLVTVAQAANSMTLQGVKHVSVATHDWHVYINTTDGSAASTKVQIWHTYTVIVVRNGRTTNFKAIVFSLKGQQAIAHRLLPGMPKPRRRVHVRAVFSIPRR